MTDSSESRGRDIGINGTQQKCNNSVVRLTQTVDLANFEISPTSIQITFPQLLTGSDRDVHVKVYDDGDAVLRMEKFQCVVASTVPTIILMSIVAPSQASAQGCLEVETFYITFK